MPNEFETRNARHAEQGAKLVDKFRRINPHEYEPDEDETVLVDAIANLFHYARTRGVAAEDIIETAHGHFIAELAEAETGEEQI